MAAAGVFKARADDDDDDDVSSGERGRAVADRPRPCVRVAGRQTARPFAPVPRGRRQDAARRCRLRAGRRTRRANFLRRRRPSSIRTRRAFARPPDVSANGHERRSYDTRSTRQRPRPFAAVRSSCRTSSVSVVARFSSSRTIRCRLVRRSSVLLVFVRTFTEDGWNSNDDKPWESHSCLYRVSPKRATRFSTPVLGGVVVH